MENLTYGQGHALCKKCNIKKSFCKKCEVWQCNCSHCYCNSYKTDNGYIGDYKKEYTFEFVNKEIKIFINGVYIFSIVGGYDFKTSSNELRTHILISFIMGYLEYDSYDDDNVSLNQEEFLFCKLLESDFEGIYCSLIDYYDEY